jgi:outer membrane protein OmpA-like peptidoglycan-associated protein
MASSAFRSTVIILLLCLFRITLPEGIPAQDFTEVQDLLNQALAEGAELLSPKSFQAAREEYQKAVELRDKGKSLSEIEKRLKTARQITQSVSNNIKLAEVTFADVLPQREKAVRARAEEFVPEQWGEIEEEFREAVVGLEEGKVKRAKELVTPLSDGYRDVELEAIREDITGSARTLSETIEKQVMPWAPMTYRNGVKKIDEVDRLLNKDRYAREDAEARIREAEYELRHSQALSRRIESNENTEMETIQLGFESDLRRIAEGLGIDARFDGDIETQVEKMVETSRELVQRNRDISGELYTLEEEMSESQELKESLQLRLGEEKRKKERLSRVQSLFSVSEVNIIRDERNVILRILGFTFPPGTATIQPEYFNLLSRVQKAIMEFPGSKVVIEGHTDSMGEERQNKSLSQNRAEAIQKYLVANLGLDPVMVQAVGYGEERPIANNETQEGRALNRRVEIVIHPAD